MSKLKLYVWEGFAPSYSGGLAFALAESKEEAKKLIIEEHYDPEEWGDSYEYEVDKKVAFAVSGGG